jgi:Kef-type K+ transport system membrane component KefB
MIAGVITGPSLFGLLFPSWPEVIFPKDSLKLLYVLAQFGVGLYMFLVGRSDIAGVQSKTVTPDNPVSAALL